MVSRRFFIVGLTASILASLGVFPAVFAAARRYRPKGYTGEGYYRVEGGSIELPMPSLDGPVSLEKSLAHRRSIREYTSEPLRLEELSQILWAAYGVSEVKHGFKTAPSAGATYPLNVYAVIYPGGVVTLTGEFIEGGSYIYEPEAHRLTLVKKGDMSRELYGACLEQEWVLEAKTSIVITAVYERTTRRYGNRGVRYVLIEVGHAGQNIYLQATALGLATVAIGAFYDDRVREIIGAGEAEHPLYVMPLARPARKYQIREEELKAYIERRRR